MRKRTKNLPELAPLGLPAAELSAIARNSTPLTVTAGERLARQGELGRQFFLLLDGTVEVVRNGQVIGTVGALEPLGEIGMRDERLYRTADAFATTDGRVLVFSRREWSVVQNRAPQFAAMVEAIADRRVAELAG